MFHNIAASFGLKLLVCTKKNGIPYFCFSSVSRLDLFPLILFGCLFKKNAQKNPWEHNLKIGSDSIGNENKGSKNRCVICTDRLL